MAVPFPANIIVAWPSTVASIPSGWTRETALDDRYVKGAPAGIDPGATGGGTSHSHGSPSHTHTVASHAHTINPVTGPGDSQTYSGTTTAQAAGGHTHTIPDSGAITGTTSGTPAVWNSTATDPPFVRVIWIKSDGTPTGIPASAWAFWNSSPLPTSWSQPAAAKNAFLKGAAAGGNGGATGGTTTHVHTAAAHTHASIDNHTHAGGATGVPSATISAGGNQSPGSVSTHTHTASFNAAAAGSGASATAADTAAANHEPAWRKHAIVQNDTGAQSLPTGIIALWLGALATIPDGWRLCDGAGGRPDLRDRFVKGADLLAELGTTGGSTGHDHTDPAGHTHTVDHTHQITIAADGAQAGQFSGVSSPGPSSGGHGHGTGPTSSSVGGASGSTVQTVDTNVATEPPFTTVAFLQFGGSVDVTIDSPTEGQTVTTPAVVIDWSLGGGATQNDYRLIIYASDQSTVVYDTGQIASAATVATVPSGVLLTGQTYYAKVSVHDTSGNPGVSALRRFLTSWALPSTVTGLTVTPVGSRP